MRHYKQITADERRTIAMLHFQGNNFSEIARVLGRHRSTISREYRRNLSERNSYESTRAIEKTRARRSRCRKFCHFSPEDLTEVWALLAKKYSPEQISNKLHLDGRLDISHETIYKFIWRNKKLGGALYKHLRQSPKMRRKRYRSYDSRGQLAGKRPLEARPAGARNRSRTGHFEIDTVMGKGSLACLLTMVDRKTGYVHIQKMRKRNTLEANRAIFNVLHREKGRVKTITGDNGTEFHQYKDVERETNVKWYFAKPYHSWERGTNENTNGLIRQYFPKGISLARVTQNECDWVAKQLNYRPRKRFSYRTPIELHKQYE